MHKVMGQDSWGSPNDVSLSFNAYENGLSSLVFNIIYFKGSSVFRMIQHILGDEMFMNGIRKYLDDK